MTTATAVGTGGRGTFDGGKTPMSERVGVQIRLSDLLLSPMVAGKRGMRKRDRRERKYRERERERERERRESCWINYDA